MKESLPNWSRPDGVAYQSGATPVRACDMNWCQIGAAPTNPVELWLRGVLSGFPTQVTVVNVGVNPSVQLSRKPSDVPVFAATCRPLKVRSLLQPNSRHRFWSSERMLAMM